MNKLLESCTLCPRECKIDRYKKAGFCGETDKLRIARAELHYWEEPCISGEKGSGTVFFSGCNLKCCFCQNYVISAQNKGFEISVKQLANTFLMLQNRGAENINLVTPTHFVPHIIEALDMVRQELKIPVVYNCGGYEKCETLEMLRGYVDIFLPDMKYYSNELSKELSSVSNYFEKCTKTVKKMVEIVGKPVFDERGMLKSGVIVRHLVLPNCRHDSMRIIKWLGENFEKDEILLSMMSQYVPVYNADKYKKINRKTTTFEYNSVVKEIEKYGFDGYLQEKSSSSSDFIPKFYDYLYYELNN